MHESSVKSMRAFFDTFVKSPVSVLDIGSKGGHAYRDIALSGGHSYVGLDVEAGQNVDIVAADIYSWKKIKDETYDVLISGQAFEHIEFFWLTFREMVRVLKKGGCLCLIVPSKGDIHRYPFDCWRFYPDSMRALAKWGNVELMESTTDEQADWGDCKGVFKK